MQLNVRKGAASDSPVGPPENRSATHVKKNESTAELLVDDSSSTPPVPGAGEVVIGTVVGLDGQGQPLVQLPGNPSPPVAAMSTVAITVAHAGRNVALLFAKGDPQRPVIVGVIHSPLHDLLAVFDAKTASAPAGRVAKSIDSADTARSNAAFGIDDVIVDGKRVVLEGKDEVVIRCGEASITLTKAGKILICGNYLLNQSNGVNRIEGGSVQIN